MTRKRKSGEKGKAGAQKKVAQKRDGRTSSSRTRSQSQTKCKYTSHPSPSRSRDHGGHSSGSTEPEPLSKDAQTQTSPSGLENKETQTETVSQATQQTQTELNGNTETTEVSTELGPEDVKMEVETGLSRNKGNESDGQKDESVERKKRKVGETREPTEETKEKTKLSDGCRNQDGDDQKDKAANKKCSEGDSQKDTKLKSITEEPKLYAAAAGVGKTEQSKEQRNQTATVQDNSKRRKPSPVRAPAEQPVFTFYIYAVLDKKFRFNRQHDSLLLLQGNKVFELQITYFLGLQQEGYLIEATFSLWQGIDRGVPIEYRYAVQKQSGPIMETALRRVYVPTENTVKEWHLYEGYISSSSRSVKERVTDWIFQNAQEEICKRWETSAHALLDRVFKKWGSFNDEDNKTLIQHLNSYKQGFQSVMRRLKFPEHPSPSQIEVSELISSRLSWILKGGSGGKPSESSSVSKSLEAALSVFQVCCGCGVDLGTKDWGKLCQVVSEMTASLGEMQTTLTAVPLIDYTVTGLMNQCARKLISEVVLLVPVLHLLRKSGAMPDPDSAMIEQRWAGLENIEYPSFRERIRGLSDKRRMVHQLIKDHSSMTKDNPYLLKSWLSMVAFEDVPEFVQLTGIVPELLIQTLMYRMKEAEQNTDHNCTEKNLEATEKVLNLLLKRVEEDRERIMEPKLFDLILRCCRNVHKSVCKITRLVPQYRVTVLSFKLLLKTAEILHDYFSKVLYH
ncbi:E3 ubiquitin-protein ligase rnf213-beta-like [Sinocyclocheilus anshuiensis]|uniref:E3 ubiquitin-protein ligase rnf213-beta-like n=1 Tax=Sinocyclocheilus anshuiensis TaxID=1608454 RepID=UPI0007B9A3A7|nr:PREDICTED: E3 ubiquitin-protein ligase rnf213-beta-like [Sinocyclocheilus anshuiensis]